MQYRRPRSGGVGEMVEEGECAASAWIWATRQGKLRLQARVNVSRVQVSLHEKAPVVRRWWSCHACAVPTQAAVVEDMAVGVYVLCHRPRCIVVSQTSRVERRPAALRANAILTAVQSHVRNRSSGSPSRRSCLRLQ